MCGETVVKTQMKQRDLTRGKDTRNIKKTLIAAVEISFVCLHIFQRAPKRVEISSETLEKQLYNCSTHNNADNYIGYMQRKWNVKVAYGRQSHALKKCRMAAVTLKQWRLH